MRFLPNVIPAKAGIQECAGNGWIGEYASLLDSGFGAWPRPGMTFWLGL